jgi:hypothetical protein
MLVPRGGKSSSTPELVLGGSQPKQWFRDESGFTYMRKAEFPEQVHGEMLAVKLARFVKFPVMNAFIETDSGRVYADDYSAATTVGTINLVNMTTDENSLIQFDQMNIGINGLSPTNVIDAFQKAGVKHDVKNAVLRQIIFDGVTGNIDRESNNSNWAVFMCNRTGQRSVSPMYDFNWANADGESQITDKIAANIRAASLSDESAAIVEKLKEACAALGLSRWRENAAKLAALLV